MKSCIGKVIDEKGYKRKYVAEKMEISQKQLSNWVTGKSFPTVEKLFKLASLLECKVDDLYTNDKK
ncbi:helix-turn-helix transcriptional regulator [Halalkalibacterium ligniniphilum]|uniref:helix-turn-helix transcriptional regulator n=1 Tax=Halalkalibacterium ligniniphilum TaxID=1134413 RepID=UPI0003491A66|nr:helix-turn-helix transcriptional regulator [Halalkalibacterium ligniniphilum]